VEPPIDRQARTASCLLDDADAPGRRERAGLQLRAALPGLPRAGGGWGGCGGGVWAVDQDTAAPPGPSAGTGLLCRRGTPNPICMSYVIPFRMPVRRGIRKSGRSDDRVPRLADATITMIVSQRSEMLGS